jgi:hypothetical protein
MTQIHPDDFEALVLWAILLHDWARIHGVERTIVIENYHVLGPPGPLAKTVLSGMMESCRTSDS